MPEIQSINAEDAEDAEECEFTSGARERTSHDKQSLTSASSASSASKLLQPQLFTTVFAGSINGIGTTVALRSPSQVSTVTRVPKAVEASGSIA